LSESPIWKRGGKGDVNEGWEGKYNCLREEEANDSLTLQEEGKIRPFLPGGEGEPLRIGWRRMTEGKNEVFSGELLREKEAKRVRRGGG